VTCTTMVLELGLATERLPALIALELIF